MADISIDGAKLSGVLRLTWMTDQLAHVLDHNQTDEPTGTWTGLACPDHGLPLGADVDNATLQRLTAQSDVADLIWEAPADLATEHGQLLLAASRRIKRAITRSASGSGSRPTPSGPGRGQRTARRSNSFRPQA